MSAITAPAWKPQDLWDDSLNENLIEQTESTIKQRDPYRKVDFKQTLSQNSTAKLKPSPEIIEEFESLFAIGGEGFFDDAMGAEFSSQLLVLMEQYREMAIEILTDFIVGEKVGKEVASEALAWIGHIQHDPSRLSRRRFLERCLMNCRSAMVRYGAVLGLSYIDDPLSIPTVKRKIEQETIPSLKQDQEQLLTQLEATKREKA